MPSNHLILCHPLLLLPSIFPSIRVFSNELFASGGQSIGVSASTSVLPMNTQDWSPLGWTGWISLQSKRLSRVFSNTTIQKHQFFGAVFFTVQLSHPYMTTGKTIALTRRTFVGKAIYLIFSMLSRLVIAFNPRSKHLLISWLKSPFTVILEPPKIKSVTISIVSPSICHEVIDYFLKAKQIIIITVLVKNKQWSKFLDHIFSLFLFLYRLILDSRFFQYSPEVFILSWIWAI